MQRREQREFDAFVSAVGGRLLHTAELLTGDPGRAERRVARALARTYLKWRQSTELDPTRIAHRALLSGYLDPWRRLPWKPQPLGSTARAVAVPKQGAEATSETEAAGDAESAYARAEVLRGLDRLTRLERAAAVLRAYAGLDDFDAAEALGVSEESVAEAFARAAHRLDSTAARGPAAGTVVWTAGIEATRPDPGASHTSRSTPAESGGHKPHSDAKQHETAFAGVSWRLGRAARDT